MPQFNWEAPVGGPPQSAYFRWLAAGKDQRVTLSTENHFFINRDPLSQSFFPFCFLLVNTLFIYRFGIFTRRMDGVGGSSESMFEDREWEHETIWQV